MSKRTDGPFDAYDFDKTIYHGDCSLDFYIYCVSRQPLTLRFLPYQVWHFAMFAIGRESRTKFKQRFFIFLRGHADTEKLVGAFWRKRGTYIKQWYAGLDHSRDVIVSASPEFLLKPIAQKLGVAHLIATRMNPATGEIDGENCWGKEKVVRLRQELGSPEIRRAYTDSLSDLPMLSLAAERYIVRGDEVYTLQDYAKLPRVKKFAVPEKLDPID